MPIFAIFPERFTFLSSCSLVFVYGNLQATTGPSIRSFLFLIFLPPNSSENFLPLFLLLFFRSRYSRMLFIFRWQIVYIIFAAWFSDSSCKIVGTKRTPHERQDSETRLRWEHLTTHVFQEESVVDIRRSWRPFSFARYAYEELRRVVYIFLIVNL